MSVVVRNDLMQRCYCPQKDQVSVSVRDNIIQIPYCPQKDRVSVSILDNIIPSIYCQQEDGVSVLWAAIYCLVCTGPERTENPFLNAPI